MTHASPGEQRAQARYRDWAEALALLPRLEGRRVLDLGCGIGTFSALLAEAGAKVIGVDADADALATARERHPHIRFEQHDLRAVDRGTFGRVDGIWSAFVTAFFPDLPAVVDRWDRCLGSGGWMALVEVDDLLGHEPCDASTRTAIEGFYAASRASGGYDFLCGRRLAGLLDVQGFVVHTHTLRDDELAFVGPASADVLHAWEARFARMEGLRNHFGTGAGAVEQALLAAMRAPDHVARAKVCFALGTRGHWG